jgi:hypothetical protein
LRSIRIKLEASKKKGQTAQMLRTILARSANLVNV